MPNSTTEIVPLVSSGTVGPLGAMHVPRLWCKLTLANAGLLAQGYDQCGQGFDQMTIDGLGLKRESVLAFFRDTKPTYMQFEDYIVAQNGGGLRAETIAAHNAAIAGYNHADDLAASMRKTSGIGGDTTCDAVTLNGIDDLDQLHAQVVKR